MNELKGKVMETIYKYMMFRKGLPSEGKLLDEIHNLYTQYFLSLLPEEKPAEGAEKVDINMCQYFLGFNACLSTIKDKLKKENND